MNHDEDYSQESGVHVVVDGPDVHPSTVSARPVLELVAAYIALLEKDADLHGAKLHFSGIRIVDKCVMVASTPSSLDAAKTAARNFHAYSRGAPMPHGLTRFFERVMEARKRLPSEMEATVGVGDLAWPLICLDLSGLLPESTFSGRVRVNRVGGTKAVIRFLSESEDAPFVLTISAEQAPQLGALLYSEVDIEAVILRDADGSIRGGHLVSFEKVTDQNPREAWLAWMAENAPRWQTVEDIDAELFDDEDAEDAAE